MTKTAIIFLLFLSIRISFAQPVTITGKAEGQADQLVRVIVYADQFSHLLKTLATTHTDGKGNFEIKLDVEKTNFAFLAVGLKKGEFYLKPGAKYSFVVLKDTSTRQRSVFDELPLQFTMTAADAGLNRMIGDYNEMYNQFIYRNATRIYQGRGGQLIAGFEERAKMQFGKTNDLYFLNYMKYSFASLEWIGQKKATHIISKYFFKQSVLYNNIQYTEFFNEFMKAYLGSTEYFDYREIIAAIRSENALEAIDGLLERDSIFREDPGLRALSTLLLLVRKSHSSDLPKGRVADLFKEIHQKSPDKTIREIAGNYYTKLQKLQAGSPAPAFALEDAKGDTVRINQFNGRFVLLSFIRPDCRVCLLHLEELSKLQEKFSVKVQNITIVNGANYRETVSFAESRLYDWPFLDLKKNILLLEDYEIKTYPTYAIINPDGTIAMIPAPMPDESLEIYLIRMMINYDKNRPKK
jgi:peroxiredoxin